MASTLERLVGAVNPELTAGIGIALPAMTSLSVQGTLLYPIIERAAGRIPTTASLPKLSANEIIRRVRQMGFGVKRQPALKAIKAMKTQAASYDYISTLTPGAKPLMSMVPFASDKQPLKYQYTVLLTGTDRDTGEQNYQYIRINSPRLLSKNQATAMATDAILEKQKYQITDVTEGTVLLITRENPNIEV